MIDSPVSWKPIGCKKPVWIDIADRYPDDRDCLAAFIAFETAEVLDGVKPSCLINLTDRPRRCGRKIYSIWKEHGEDLLRWSLLEARVMVERPGSLLLLLYDRSALERLLCDKRVLAILRRGGYRDECHVDSLLSRFASRFAEGSIPHEIGMILGYPIKDVAGFMGIGRQRFTCQGLWKIYGDPRESLMLAERHLQCRRRMAGRLMQGCGPYAYLGGKAGDAGGGQNFFSACC